MQILKQTNVKNVNPVSDAGIQTHNLWNINYYPITARPVFPVTKIIQSRMRAKQYRIELRFC